MLRSGSLPGFGAGKDGCVPAVGAVFIREIDEAATGDGCAGLGSQGGGKIVVLAKPVLHGDLVRSMGSTDVVLPFLRPGFEACGELCREVKGFVVLGGAVADPHGEGVEVWAQVQTAGPIGWLTIRAWRSVLAKTHLAIETHQLSWRKGTPSRLTGRPLVGLRRLARVSGLIFVARPDDGHRASVSSRSSVVWRIRDRLVSGRPGGYCSEGIAILPGLFPLQLDRLTWDKGPEAFNAYVAEMGPATTRSLGRVDYSPPLLIQPEPDAPLRAHQTRIAPIRSVVPHADLLWGGQVLPRYPVAGSPTGHVSPHAVGGPVAVRRVRRPCADTGVR